METLVSCWSSPDGPWLMLAAGGGDLFGIVVFILFVLASLISQLLQQKNPVERKRSKPGSPVSDAAEEIRKFFEQTAEQQKQKQKQKREEQKSNAGQSKEGIVTATAVTDVRPAVRRESVGEHVRQHIGQKNLAKVVSQLESADEQLESHLHQVFDHRLGNIARDAPVPSIAQGTDAADQGSAVRAESRAGGSKNLAREIAQAMRDPATLRQAIIINEVLRRRDDVLGSRKQNR